MLTAQEIRALPRDADVQIILKKGELTIFHGIAQMKRQGEWIYLHDAGVAWPAIRLSEEVGGVFHHADFSASILSGLPR